MIKRIWKWLTNQSWYILCHGWPYESPDKFMLVNYCTGRSLYCGTSYNRAVRYKHKLNGRKI